MKIKFEQHVVNEFIQDFTNTDPEQKYFLFQLTMHSCDVFKKTVYLWITTFGGSWVLWNIINLSILVFSDYDPESMDRAESWF